MAALYLDAGLQQAEEVFARIWTPEFEAVQEAGVANPKSDLQEWAAGLKLPPPLYEVTSRTGPPHAPTFTVQLTLGELEPASGQGGSRQEAEKAAAQAMLEREAMR